MTSHARGTRRFWSRPLLAAAFVSAALFASPAGAQQARYQLPHASCLAVLAANVIAGKVIIPPPDWLTGPPEQAAGLLGEIFDGGRPVANRPACNVTGLSTEQLQHLRRGVQRVQARLDDRRRKAEAEIAALQSDLDRLMQQEEAHAKKQRKLPAVQSQVAQIASSCQLQNCAQLPEIKAQIDSIAKLGPKLNEQTVAMAKDKAQKKEKLEQKKDELKAVNQAIGELAGLGQ